MKLFEELKRIEEVDHPGIYASMLKDFIIKLQQGVERCEKIIKDYKNKL